MVDAFNIPIKAHTLSFLELDYSFIFTFQWIGIIWKKLANKTPNIFLQNHNIVYYGS